MRAKIHREMSLNTCFLRRTWYVVMSYGEVVLTHSGASRQAPSL
jgi:hypothetical protein